MSEGIPDDLIHAAFFFVDIVGLSNPIISTETQRTKIKVLNESIYNCTTFLSCSKNDLFILPTGDGMLIGFKNGLEEPIKLSKELHQKLDEYNSNALDTEKIYVRIGCNVGHIFIVKDVFGHINLWGPGAILARRVMDLGDQNHVLLTSHIAEDLLDLSQDYNEIIHPINDFTIKHDEEILIYSVYDNNFGNQNIPKKILENNPSLSKPLTIEQNTICEKIIFNIKLSSNNTLKHERIYQIVNQTNEPIYKLNIGIITNSPKKFEDLNLQAFDENDNSLKIEKIIFHSPYTHEISVTLEKPVFMDDANRIIKIIYTITEATNYFENLFQTDATKFELNLTVPYDFKPIPKLYYVNSKIHIKNLIEPYGKLTKGLTSTFRWENNEGINLKDIIRLEW